MKVKDSIEKLNEYNKNANVEICIICFGSSEGCTKLTCDCVDFMVGTACDEEGGVKE